MTVSVHVAPHPDTLVARLCDQLATPPEDPFAAELIAVPTRGIERWLTQQIAVGFAVRGIGDGISANIDFPSPARLVREVLLAVPDLAAAVAAYEGPALTGHILDAIDQYVDEPWLRLVARYIEPAAGNRLAAAAKITPLFGTYGRRRPEMIRAWAAGDETGDDTGPAGTPVPEADSWQPRLWRLVRERIGEPALAELLTEGLEPIRSGAIELDLPDRIAVYGLTAADPLELQVLTALGEQRDVHLYVLHPSPALWDAVAGKGVPAHMPRGTDPTAQLGRHPMLASWGRDARELQLLLAAHGLTADPIDDTYPEPGSVLTRLQDDIRANRPLASDDALAAAVTEGADRSLQIHVTHGARRQVEVARDAILHVLNADPTLEPRDIVIMTPDLATFAPLLEAAFPADNGSQDSGLPDLRLRIADRSPAAINPLVRFAATVLDLADSRLEANVVRELVTRPVVQQRFGFDLDTAGSIISVIDDGHISWGLDATDRAAWHAGDSAERTWSRGLDRALAGVFYSDDPVRVVATTAPLDGIEGQEAAPVGLLAAIMDRIVTIRDMLAEPLPASQWARAISNSVRLLAAPGWDDEWQLGQLERLLAETFPPPAPGAPDPRLSLPEARGAIAGWTETRPSPLHFRTGDVTVCTLVPMRSVPYRVVCLLGMDDDRFPRSSRSDGDDLLLTDEIVGDFDRSSQDRQLLLDAVMAAGDHLIIAYSGRDELTNTELPPAVPIAELYDTLGAMVGPAALGHIETVHPLQSFSEANFIAGALTGAGPFGFDLNALAGAYSVAGYGAAPGPAATWPDPEPTDEIELPALIAFLAHPARRFMAARMGFTVPELGDIPDDTLPADLGGLGAWALKERLSSGLADGYDIDELVARERSGDGLPPGALGDDDLATAIDTATVLWNAALERGYDREAMQPYRGSVALGDVTVAGTVLADPEQAHLAVLTASKVKAKQRLRSFTELVFLSALRPEAEWKSILLGRNPNWGGHVAVTMGPIGDDPEKRRHEATAMLAELVALYIDGHEAPLPIPCETAYLWQRNVGSDRDKAWGKAREAWETDRFSPEFDDPAHQLLLADLRPMRALLGAGFESYCRRLWGPILPLSREKKL